MLKSYSRWQKTKTLQQKLSQTTSIKSVITELVADAIREYLNFYID